MKKIAIALAAVVATAGIASAQVTTLRDAAPVSQVVNQAASLDHSSTSSVGTTAGATNQQEREQIIKQRADNR